MRKLLTDKILLYTSLLHSDYKIKLHTISVRMFFCEIKYVKCCWKKTKYKNSQTLCVDELIDGIYLDLLPGVTSWNLFKWTYVKLLLVSIKSTNQKLWLTYYQIKGTVFRNIQNIGSWDKSNLASIRFLAID